MLNRIKRIKSRAREMFSSASGSHNWEHTLRVFKLATHIAKKEDADLDIVQISSYLHDIGRQYEDRARGDICHAEKGAKMAEQIMKEEGLDERSIRRVSHCIRAHRFRNNNEPDSLEAKILFDADKLDSIGAVGVGRAFLFAGEIGAKLHNKNITPQNTQSYTEDDTAYREFLVKLRKIKDKIYTSEGQKLAKERHEYMSEFFNRLNKEVEGIY